MGKSSGKDIEDKFIESLKGKDVPILTLDNKWYRLINRVGLEHVKKLENELNELLKRQGKMTTETRDIKRLKKRLMEEMVTFAELARSGDAEAESRLGENKRLVAECNDKLDSYQEELLDVPGQIEQINRKLMLLTMEHCYDTLSENTDEIEALEEWVTGIRIQLKKNLIRKQEMEAKNHEIYSYMHAIFGPEVVNLFDMRYNPEEHYPKTKESKGDDNENDSQTEA